MSDSIILDSNGMRTKKWKDGEYKFQDVDLSKGIANHLRGPLVLANNFTLKDFARFLLSMTDEDLSFIESHAWCNVLPFIEEIFEKTDEKHDDIECLEVYNFGETWDHGEGKNELEIGQGFHGLGKPDKDGNRTNWGFGPSSLSGFADLPIKIDNELQIWQWKTESKERPVSLGKMHKEITLGEFIDAILWEISFYGEPKDRNEFFDKVNKIRDESIKRMKDDSKK